MLSICIHILYKVFPDSAPVAASLRTESVASFLLISAGYYLIRDRFERFAKPWVIGLAICLTVVLSPIRGSWMVTPFLLAFIVNHLQHSPKMFMWILENRFVRLMGLMSFSIYLFQQPVYKHFVQAKGLSLLESTVYLLVAMIISVVSFYFIEKRLRQWLNNNW